MRSWMPRLIIAVEEDTGDDNGSEEEEVETGTTLGAAIPTATVVVQAPVTQAVPATALQSMVANPVVTTISVPAAIVQATIEQAPVKTTVTAPVVPATPTITQVVTKPATAPQTTAEVVNEQDDAAFLKSLGL